MNDHEALRILGVVKATNFQEVANAYKRLAISLHPDRSKEKPEIADQKFKRISGAFRHLEERQKGSVLVLPIIQGPDGVGQIPRELSKFLDPAILKILIGYLVTKTPKWMQPTLKQVCEGFDPLAIIAFTVRNGIRIPDLFGAKKVKGTKKPKKPKKTKNPKKVTRPPHPGGDLGRYGQVVKRAIINREDCSAMNRLPANERAAFKVRCVLETRNLATKQSKEEHVELSLPEGLNPSGKISLDGQVWDITLTNEPWGGPPPVGSISNPKITSTTKQPMDKAPNPGMGTTVQNLQNIASMVAAQRNQQPQPRRGHTPPQKLGPGDNLWPPGKTFLP